MLAAACLSLRLCAPRERVPLIATPPCIYARTTPFGQFFSCTSAQTQPGPTLTLTPTVCGAGARQGFSCVSVAFFHKKKQPAERPASTNQAARGVARAFFYNGGVGCWGLGPLVLSCMSGVANLLAACLQVMLRTGPASFWFSPHPISSYLYFPSFSSFPCVTESQG